MQDVKVEPLHTVAANRIVELYARIGELEVQIEVDRTLHWDIHLLLLVSNLYDNSNLVNILHLPY